METLLLAGVVLALACSAFALGKVRALTNTDATRLLVILLIVTAGALIGFSWWGQYAPEGHRAYDEMDALYPFAAGLLGLLLTMIAALAGWWAGRKN